MGSRVRLRGCSKARSSAWARSHPGALAQSSALGKDARKVEKLCKCGGRRLPSPPSSGTNDGGDAVTEQRAGLALGCVLLGVRSSLEGGSGRPEVPTQLVIFPLSILII